MGGEACFQIPTAPLARKDGTPIRIGCGPIVPTPAPTAVAISGDVATFGTTVPLVGAEIRLFGNPEFTTVVATATSQADSKYVIQLPAGTPDLMWGTVAAPGMLTSYVHAYRPDLGMGDIADFNLRLFKPENLEGAAILVKESWDPAFAVLAGYAVDCDRNVLQHAAVVLSAAAGRREFVDGASLYYGAPGAVPLAVPPEERGDTNDNGVFAVFRVPSGRALVAQVWGFSDDAAQAQGEAGLVLVAEHPLHAVANGVAQINLWPNK